MGIISCDSPGSRDLVLNLGISDHIERLLAAEGNSLALRQATARLLSNMCRGESDVNLVIPLMSIAATYFQQQTVEDDEILSELLWALASVSESKDAIDLVLATGVTSNICAILMGNCVDSFAVAGIRTIVEGMRPRYRRCR